MRSEKSYFFQALQREVEQNPQRGAVLLMQTIVEMLNLHPSLQSLGSLEKNWLQKTQELMDALQYFIDAMAPHEELIGKLEQTQSFLRSIQDEMHELQQKIVVLQENTKQQTLERDKLKEQLQFLQGIQTLLQASETFQRLYWRYRDDHAVLQHVIQRAPQLEAKLQKAQMVLDELEQDVRELALSSESAVEEIGGLNGRS